MLEDGGDVDIKWHHLPDTSFRTQRDNLKGGKVVEGTKMAHKAVVAQNDAAVLVKPRENVLHHNASTVLPRAAWLSSLGDAILKPMLSHDISARLSVVSLVPIQAVAREGKTFGQLR